MIDWDAVVLAPMMDASIFGETVQPLYQSQFGGLPFLVDGVFDDAYTALSLEGDEPAVSTFSPVMGVRLAQFPPAAPPTQGDSVTISSVQTTYKVMNVQADGHGWAKLVLMSTGAL